MSNTEQTHPNQFNEFWEQDGFGNTGEIVVDEYGATVVLTDPQDYQYVEETFKGYQDARKFIKSYGFCPA